MSSGNRDDFPSSFPTWLFFFKLIALAMSSRIILASMLFSVMLKEYYWVKRNPPLTHLVSIKNGFLERPSRPHHQQSTLGKTRRLMCFSTFVCRLSPMNCLFLVIYYFQKTFIPPPLAWARMSRHWCGDQRLAFRTGFSVSTIWVLGIELRSSELVGSAFGPGSSHQLPQTLFLLCCLVLQE